MKKYDGYGVKPSKAQENTAAINHAKIVDSVCSDEIPPEAYRGIRQRSEECFRTNSSSSRNSNATPSATEAPPSHWASATDLSPKAHGRKKSVSGHASPRKEARLAGSTRSP